MSSEMRWRVHIKNMESQVKVGIHSHEQKPQRLLISADIEGVYPAYPQSISECFDYDHVHKLVAGEWPKRGHTELLETFVTELLEHIFTVDNRVDFVRASVSKPDIFAHAESVGVEAEWTRKDYERLKQK